MNHNSDVQIDRKSDRERISEVDLNSLSPEQLRALYDEIFGEPGDEEIAADLREAEAEYEAGDYSPSPLDTEDDNDPYREQRKEEILRGVKQAFKEALASDVLTEEQFRTMLSR